jgi:hypothetical protein
MEMTQDQIAMRWHQYFVNQLQARYGLAENEARQKADALLKGPSKEQSAQEQAVMAAAFARGRRPSRTSTRNLRSSAAC